MLAKFLAPELIVEIAASTASYDLYDKLRVYRRNGVQEYLVWRVNDKQLNWFRLRQDEYVQLEANSNGVIRSEIFPGLWLDVSALINGDLAQVLAVVQEGLATEENGNFVNRLNAT